MAGQATAPAGLDALLHAGLQDLFNAQLLDLRVDQLRRIRQREDHGMLASGSTSLPPIISQP